MRITICATALIAAWSFAAVPALAQDTAANAAASVAAPPACELHVYPTLEGQAQTTGWLSGFGFVGALADAAANKSRNVGDAAYLKEALGPKMQVDALKTIDLVAALKLDPSQIIFETPIADRKITTKATTRLSNSTAPCYAELIVTQNFYQKAAIYGRSLSNRFIFKDFRTGKTKTAMVKGRGRNGLSLFPPKTTDDAPAAEKELSDVLIKNFLEFAKTIKASK